MKPRIIFIHGNQTTHWSFAWVKWLKSELESMGYQTFFETMPDSIIARSRYWLPFMKEHIKAGANDVLVGWSSGAVASMRYAENNKILGSILIAPSQSDLGDELEKQSGYYDTPWQWENIKNNQKNIFLIHSDNDPFIPLEEFQIIKEKLNCHEVVLPNQGHFIEKQTFPELLKIISENF